MDALRSYVAGSPLEPPTLLARLEGVHGDDLILPLAILSAPGEDRVLARPIRVVSPLPIEDYGETGCLQNWSVAVSDELEGAEIRVPDDIKSSSFWLGGTFRKLRDFFQTKERADGEGFVLVAHHDRGRLWYKKNDFPLQTHEMSVEYGQATAAVLAMCKAGSVSSADSFLVRRLNKFGLDAAILSPFSLDANYGKAFAIEFSRLVRKARSQHRAASLGDLLQEALAATAPSMRNHPDPKVRGSVGDMGLELVLVGNPHIRLCKD